jgi:crotonobetainyl-CoA:carnitine CoA-transferase CaiB-like acyl-CoA transferase
MTKTPGGVHRRSPLLGEDTRLQLAKAGLTEAEIQSLIDARAARVYSHQKG